MRSHPSRAAMAVVALVLALVAAACGAEEPRGAVHVVPVDGTVDGVLERYLDRVLTAAEEREAQLVVLEVDTPGGLVTAMKHIVGRIERATVPVVAWVGPPGAQAVSAGTFVVMAGHVAAMAPSTSIGAASPVLATGEDLPDTLGRKVEEDTVAFARAVAEQHGRNAEWAEAAVRDAASASPNDALALGVIDLVEGNRASLLAAVQGRTVTLLDGTTVTIEVGDAPVVQTGMNAYERTLRVVSNPAIVALLLLVALAGIAIELFSPGLLLPGAVGVLALVVAFLGAGTLLPTEAALVLGTLGLALIALEFFIPGGIVGAVGAIALLLALAIGAGQMSTVISLERVLLTLLVVSVVLLGVVVVILRRFLEPTTTSRPAE